MPVDVSSSHSLTASPTAADRLVAVADAAGIGILDVDQATRAVTASSGFRRILGLPADARLTDDDWRARIHPDDRPAADAALARVVADEVERALAPEPELGPPIPWRIRRADGEWRRVDVRLRALRDTAGRVHLTALFTDVTEVAGRRRERDAALRPDDARFREAFEHAPIGMALTEPGTGRLLHVNQAYADIVGWPREALASLDFLTLTHPDDRDHNAAVYGQLMRGEIPVFAIEKRYVRRDGRAVWVRATAVVQRDETGEPQRVVGLIEDIDERRRAAERAEALQRITAALGGATTRAEVARVVATLGAAFLEASRGTLALPALDDPSCVELVEADAFAAVARRLPLDADLPPVRALRDRVPFLFATRDELVARFPDAAGWLAPLPDVDATAAAPVHVRDDVAGALLFTWAGPRLVDAHGAGRLDALARLVGGALDRVALLDALRRELADRERAEREFRTLAETVPDLVFTTSPDGTLEWYNGRTAEFCGRPWQPGAEARAAWRFDIHPDDLPQVTASWSAAVATGQPYESQARWRRAGDGAWRWMLNRAVPLRDAAGAVRLWVGTGTDIHEQRLAADRAATLQQVTTALGAAVDMAAVARVTVEQGIPAFGATSGGMWLFDASGEALEPACRIAADDDTRHLMARITLDTPTPGAEAVRTRAPLFVEDPATITARYPALAGAVAHAGVRATASLPLVVDDRVIGFLGMGWPEARRFTAEDRALLDAFGRQCALAAERARLYEAERAARAEAEAARAAAEEARRVAEAASRAKSEFLAVMSHELRTPLNAIAGHVELLEMGIHGPLSPTQLDALGRVTRAQRHLLGLITDVLNFSRIEAGRVEYEVEDVEIGELLASLAPLIEPQLAARRLTYEVRTPGTRMVVRGDRDKLRQVLLNLLSNAVKYTEPGGAVIVDTWVRDDGGAFAYVRVRDTGCGIAPEKLEAIFEPFVRVDAGHTRRTDGAGLGLAIARDHARGMGGDLRARSVVGEGSSFTVSIPLA